jgi:predicted Zn-dependent protease with MMP-like domain
MEREKFDELVAKALSELPQEFQERLENITIVVEDWPSSTHLAKLGLRHREELLGLYEGVPLIKRSVWRVIQAPNKITIFQKPIEMRCHFDQDIIKSVQEVVYHEVGHHFGLTDQRLKEIEKEKRHRQSKHH